MSVNNLSQEQAKTREEYKKAKYEAEQKINAKDAKADRAEVETKSDPQKFKRIRIRLIPVWLRLVLLVVFTFISLTAGAAVGYGILGDGKVADVFKQSTWTHIRDLVNKE
jgi:hypothetical protein